MTRAFEGLFAESHKGGMVGCRLAEQNVEVVRRLSEELLSHFVEEGSFETLVGFVSRLCRSRVVSSLW